MKVEESAVDKIEYVSYDELKSPQSSTLTQQIVDLGFQSKEWFIQFQTITNLRQANRFYSNIFINQLLPRNSKNIVGQVENLRSNNSKEALTLISEVFQFQNLKDVEEEVIRPLVSAIFVKSVSQKGFLKSQALKAIGFIPKNWNSFILDQLCLQTQSLNGNISQLAIKTMKQMIENNKEYETNDKFLKNLSSNLNGKRAVVQKQAKQILKCLKSQTGQDKLEEIISKSTDLLQEESNTLRRELKKETTDKDTKSNQSIKEFLKAKKQGK